MSEIAQGLEVSVLGILITFVALGVFIFIMIFLQRMFPYKNEDAAAVVEEREAPEAVIEIATDPATDGEEGEIAAAIGAALLYLRSRSKTSLGDSLFEGRGGWWSSHRIESQSGPLRKR